MARQDLRSFNSYPRPESSWFTTGPSKANATWAGQVFKDVDHKNIFKVFKIVWTISFWPEILLSLLFPRTFHCFDSKFELRFVDKHWEENVWQTFKGLHQTFHSPLCSQSHAIIVNRGQQIMVKFLSMPSKLENYWITGLWIEIVVLIRSDASRMVRKEALGTNSCNFHQTMSLYTNSSVWPKLLGILHEIFVVIQHWLVNSAD